MDHEKVAGLVRELHLGDGPVRYEAPEGDDRLPHLVCRGCGQIEHLEVQALATALEAAAGARGYADQEIDVVVYATCARCAEGRPLAAGNEGRIRPSSRAGWSFERSPQPAVCRSEATRSVRPAWPGTTGSGGSGPGGWRVGWRQGCAASCPAS